VATQIPRRVFGTIPRGARHVGLGLRTFKGLVKRGLIPTYHVPDCAWDLVDLDEAVAAIRALRVPPTRHAEVRVREMLADEGLEF